jgi:hypothetical protein
MNKRLIFVSNMKNLYILGIYCRSTVCNFKENLKKLISDESLSCIDNFQYPIKEVTQKHKDSIHLSLCGLLTFRWLLSHGEIIYSIFSYYSCRGIPKVWLDHEYQLLLPIFHLGDLDLMYSTGRKPSYRPLLLEPLVLHFPYHPLIESIEESSKAILWVLQMNWRIAFCICLNQSQDTLCYLGIASFCF